MPNLVMDFLDKALPTVGAVGGGILGGIGGELVDPLGGGIPGAIAGSSAGSAGGKALENKLTGQKITSGVLPAAIGGAVGQGVGGAVAGAVGDFGGGIAGAATKGATVGGTSSAASAAATGDRNLKDLTMDFLQGAGIGAATGGLAEGIRQGNAIPKNEVGAVGGNVLDDDTAAKLAKSDNEKTIQKQLTDSVGPIVAKDVSPVVAATSDPNVVHNIVNNDVGRKIAPGVGSSTNTNIYPSLSESELKNLVEAPGLGETAPNKLEGTYQAQTLPISRIGYGASPDNPQSINSATEAIRNGKPLPPITVKQTSAVADDAYLGDQYEVIDGNHRLAAYQKAGIKNIPTLVQKSTEGSHILNPEGYQPLPFPADLPPVTSVSDVNTSQQVTGQGTAAEANYNPNEQPDFLKAPGETPGKSQVGKLGIMSNMSDMLQSGSTTDEALNHYFEQVPDSTAAEAHGALDQVINSAGFDKSKLNSSLNDQYNNVEFPAVKEGNGDAARLNGTYAGEQVGKNGSQAIQAMQGLNEHDLELTRYLKGHNPEDVVAQADDKTAFRGAVSALKQYNDYTQAAGAKLGEDIPYRQDYGLRTPYEPPETPAGTPNAALPTNPSYTQQRVYNTHEEALANGEVPKNANALEDLRSDINQRAYNQTQLALANSYEKAYPGQVKIINSSTEPIPAGYHQLLIPGGDKIFLPSDIADKINTRVMATPAKGLLGKYDSVNAAGKNLELGGGLFHGFNTGGIFAGQQLITGKAFSNPSALGKVVSNLFSDKSMADYMDTLDKTPSGGLDSNHSVLDSAQASGLEIKNTSQDIGKPGDTGAAGKIANLPVLKQIHNAIFSRQIPTMMLETFRQKTQGLDIFGNADDREQAIKIAKGINNEYGSINRDIQGLTPRQFQLASRGVLATSYQEGQLVTLKNALSKGGVEGQIAREAVFGKALLFGGLATLGAVTGGDFKDQTPKQVALAIMNKTINPSFDIGGYKVSTPATQISNVAKPVEESIASARKGEGIAAGPEDFASSHLAFVPSKAEEFGSNKNFQGDAVYGKDYFGRPISKLATAENAISGIAPIPLAQTAQTATGNQSVGAAIANTVGFNANPQYDLNYAPVAGQTYIQALQDTPGVPKAKIQSATEFFDLLGQGSRGKQNVITQAETALKAGNPQKAQQLVTNYNEKLIKTLLPWEKNGGTQYLDTNMLSLLRTAELTYKKATENTNYVAKTNPTSIGVPVAALASQTNSTNQGV